MSNSSNGQGLLGQVLNHWDSQGWNSDDLYSFRMEMNGGELGGGGTAGGGGQPQQQGAPPQQQQQGGLSQEFGSPFLNEVDEAHRPIVEPYLKKWDSNITQKFQELHAKYQPYEQLGDVDQLSQAVYIAQLLENDPKQVFDFLAQELGVQAGQAQGPGQQQQNEPEVPEEFEGLPPAFVQQWQQQQQALEAIAQMLLDNQKSAQEKAQDAELDQLMTSLQEKYKDQGGFDEEYVLSKMMNGVDPDKAVKSYFDMVQNVLNQRGARQPGFPVLGGGGVTPQTNSKNVTDLSRNETKDLVAQILSSQGQS